tara:strand:+ start:240 stop:1268 length:1029 start_codon:yes stop_codon:yes gene_type:complete
MDFNYTLKYRTFDQLLEDVSIDMNTFALENMIEPQTLIKLARKLNFELGFRINQQRETILEVCHGKVRLPEDFKVFNYGLVCGDYQSVVGYDGFAGGTNMREVKITDGKIPETYSDFPAQVPDPCDTSSPTPCCDDKGNLGTCLTHNPNQPYGDALTKPRVFMNCKGESYELIQVINQSNIRKYTTLTPLHMKVSQNVDCDSPNVYYNAPNEGYIKHGFLYTSFDEGFVYINYQGDLVDDDGNLLVPDHELLNEYYEYAFKKRILENLALNGENVAQRLQLIMGDLRAARNQALSFVNTPNFAEIKQIWKANRKAQYARYYDMFSSYAPANSFRRRNNTNVV